jgi:hypothetical protein
MPTEGENEQPSTVTLPTMYTIGAVQNDGEYTDQELLNLVNYFEVSRADLKNVGYACVCSHVLIEFDSLAC